MERTLILSNVQRDFMPDGPMGIPKGNEVIPVINQIMSKFDHVLAARDWHPKNHCSFASTHQKEPREVIEIDGVKQVLWKDHCIHHSKGARFPAGLHREKIEAVFHKGADPKVDSYSAFFDQGRRLSTGLAEYLKNRNLTDLYFAGLAFDCGIMASALDAVDLEFPFVAIVVDATRPLNRKPGGEERPRKQMESKGIKMLLSKDL